jgi:hypothetical protein
MYHARDAEVPAGLVTFRLKNFELRLHGKIFKRAAPFNHDFVWPDSDFDDPDNFERDRAVFGDARYKIPLSAVAQVQARVYGEASGFSKHVGHAVQERLFYRKLRVQCRLRRHVRSNRWRYGLTGTGAIARRVESGMPDAPLAVAPQMFGNARSAYDIGSGWPIVAVAAHYQGSRPSDRAWAFSPPPFAPPLGEVRLTLTGAFPGIKRSHIAPTPTTVLPKKGRMSWGLPRAGPLAAPATRSGRSSAAASLASPVASG